MDGNTGVGEANWRDLYKSYMRGINVACWYSVHAPRPRPVIRRLGQADFVVRTKRWLCSDYITTRCDEVELISERSKV